MDQYYLAQINIAEAKAEMDTDTMSGFVAQLENINALADSPARQESSSGCGLY